MGRQFSVKRELQIVNYAIALMDAGQESIHPLYTTSKKFPIIFLRVNKNS